MAAANIQKYINPLTVEANLFLRALQLANDQESMQVDAVLCNTLETIITTIAKLLQKPISNIIVETASTHLLPAESVKSIVPHYKCKDCPSHLGSSMIKTADHLMVHHLKEAKRTSDVPNLSKKVIKYIQSTQIEPQIFFSKETIAATEKIKHSDHYQVIEASLNAIIGSIVKNEMIAVHFFGSRITGIGSSDSDLDIFVDIGNRFNNLADPAASIGLTHKYLNIVSSAIRKSSTWVLTRTIRQARVPIIRATNKTTKIECDICFSKSLGIFNTRLMIYFYQLQPIARHMCIWLKIWRNRIKFNKPLNTYSVNLMVIFFLQTQSLLPSVLQLQENLKSPQFDGPWIVNFEQLSLDDLSMEKVDTSPENCLKMLRHFFQYFADFSFKKSIICPYLGRRIKISQLEVEMPERYNELFRNQKYSDFTSLDISKPMILQDPLELNHNTMKGIAEPLAAKLIQIFKQSSATFAQLPQTK